MGIAALAALPAAGCGTKLRDYRCATAAEAAQVEIEAVWSCNRKIIVRAVRGKRFSLREFRGAVAFFEGITGIPADTRPSELGILPGPRLDRSLTAWEDWLRDHPAGLRRNAGHGEVVPLEEAH